MTKLKTIIVDDEPLALRLLGSLLADLPEVEVVAECSNGKQALEAIVQHNPDLMFLDIEMPGMNGFEVVKKTQTDIMPLIIFSTAYEKYALDAFDVHAVDYVLKPLDQERIQRAVMRAITLVDEGAEQHAHKPRIMGAIDEISDKVANASPDQQANDQSQTVTASAAQKIVVKDRDAITLVDQKDIAWIDAAGDYVCLHAEGETHIMRSTMKELLNMLDPSLFKRVHRSTIVNLSFIQQVIPHAKGECFLQLGEYDRIKVSRNYRDVVKHFLSDAP